MKSESNENNNDLKKLREEKGLSLSDVASKLKLTSSAIEKLENNDFKSLGAFTYVRGYLNHYAELLNVDVEKYINLIPKSDIEVPLINTYSGPSKGLRFRRQTNNIMNYVLGTFIVVAAGFSGWYLLKNYSEENKTHTEIVKVNTLEILPKPQLIENNNDKNTFHQSSLLPTTNNVENKTLVEEVETDTIAIPVKDIVDTSAYQIKIEAFETSWVKVENIDGTKIHNDLLRPGIVILESDKPIHFRIGNDKNVKVTINDEEIDLSKYSYKSVADFNWPIDS